MSITITLAGAVSRRLEVEKSTLVRELRRQVADELGLDATQGIQIKFVCKGRVLRDDDKALGDYKVKAGSKILVFKPKPGAAGAAGAAPCSADSESESKQTVRSAQSSESTVSDSSVTLEDSDPSLIKLRIAGVVSAKIQVSPELTVGALKQRVAEMIADTVPAQLKLLGKGKVLTPDNVSLSSLGFTASSSSSSRTKVIVMRSAEPIQAAAVEEAKISSATRLDRLREAVRAMAKRGGDDTLFDEHSDKHFFELADQDGNKVDIPPHDSEMLKGGMMCHEKAKSLLRQKDYRGALEILLLADECFNQVSPRFANAIDNAAYVSLDIVWCMYLLQDLTRLGEARTWLEKASAGFLRSHGPNLERLQQLRQGFVPERAVYVRLHLLQAIVAFHLGFVADAKTLLEQASLEEKQLRIRDEDVNALVSMGYDTKISRRAIRAAGGDLNGAINYAIEQQRKYEALASRESAEQARRTRLRRLGRTCMGGPVDLAMLDRFIAHGFEEELAAQALRQTNNHEAQSVKLLTNDTQTQILREAVFADKVSRLKERYEKVRGADTSKFEQGVQAMLGFGFRDSLARYALVTCGGDMNEASEYLMMLEDESSIDALMLAAGLTTVSVPVPVPVSAADSVAAAATSATAMPSNDTATITEVTSTSTVATSLTSADAADNISSLDHKCTEETPPPIVAPTLERTASEEKRQEVEHTINQELLADTDSLEDPESYLDLDLEAESEAIQKYSEIIFGTA
jgi:uncharacterized ubiquitin-like protein YukD